MSRPLAKLLVESGRLTPDQVADARAACAGRRSLAVEVVARGWVTEAECAELVARAFGLPYVDLADVEVSDAACRLVPGDIARRLRILPLESAGGRLTIATADPADILALDEVAFASGRQVTCVVAAESRILERLERAYGTDAQPFESLDLPEHKTADTERVDADAALRVDTVDFSVFAPASIRAGSPFTIEVWAYLRRERSDVLDIAGRAGRLVACVVSRGSPRRASMSSSTCCR